MRKRVLRVHQEGQTFQVTILCNGQARRCFEVDVGAGKGENETGEERRSGVFSHLTELQDFQRYSCSQPRLQNECTVPVPASQMLRAQLFCRVVSLIALIMTAEVAAAANPD